MLRPWGADSTIWLLRLALQSKPEGVDLDAVIELLGSEDVSLRCDARPFGNLAGASD